MARADVRTRAKRVKGLDHPAKRTIVPRRTSMEEGMVYVRFGRLAMGGLLMVLVLVLAACGGSATRQESAEKGERAAEHGGSASEREREAEELKSGHRTLFESDRRPDHTPAAEDVGDRAYPRTYVETKRALAGRAAV